MKYTIEDLKANGDIVFGDKRYLPWEYAEKLFEEHERMKKALIYLSDCCNYMDIDFVLDHVEDTAKEGLGEI